MRVIVLIVMAAGGLRAQAPLTPEPLSGWLHFKEVRAPHGLAGWADFQLDGDTLDRARANQEDLRLYSSDGHEIPYVLRVRREVQTSNEFPVREFNRGSDGAATQLSLDLGERSEQHNQVEIETAGNNFRRLVNVQGSMDGSEWSTLASDAILFRFAAGGRTVEQTAVSYPVSRYRYLRVRVARDPQTDRGVPEVAAVRVRRTVRVPGEFTSTAGSMEGRDADRVNSRPASIWRVDLGGRIPIQRVLITAGDGVFSRPFQLDAVDDPGAPELLASGELSRAENGSAQLAVDFTEHVARHLKLTVTDDRNPPLSIVGLTAQGAAREVVFDASMAGPGVLRLYYGNSRALAPRYDLAARVRAEMPRPGTRLVLGPERDNPVYRPEPKPFSERAPWLVYVVLGIAGAVLGAILMSLVRESARRTVAGPERSV